MSGKVAGTEQKKTKEARGEGNKLRLQDGKEGAVDRERTQINKGKKYTSPPQSSQVSQRSVGPYTSNLSLLVRVFVVTWKRIPPTHLGTLMRRYNFFPTKIKEFFLYYN